MRQAAPVESRLLLRVLRNSRTLALHFFYSVTNSAISLITERPFSTLSQSPIAMTHVVTESCIRCRYTDCVDVCPVDCFRKGPNFLVIDPEECIDCAVCIPECPVNAIFAEEDVPDDQKAFIELNAELSAVWPSITRLEPHPEDADEWAKVKEKRQFLER